MGREGRRREEATRAEQQVLLHGSGLGWRSQQAATETRLQQRCSRTGLTHRIGTVREDGDPERSAHGKI